MDINLSEFLKEFCPDIPDSVRAGRIYKLTYSEDLKNFSFFAEYGSIVPYSDISAFNAAVTKALELESASLNPRYPKELFELSCMPDLIERLKRQVSVVNGFLNDADIAVNGSEINISLKHGGNDILAKCGFKRELSQLIYNQFGLSMNVNLEGENAVSAVEYDEIIEKAAAELPDYSDQIIPEKTAEELHSEAAAAAVPNQCIDNTIADLVFDRESASILYGKAIRETPRPIGEAVQNLGTKVTVVGDVFAKEIKELRNGKNVATFSITDYSGSLLIKCFIKAEEKEYLDTLGSIKSGVTLLVSGKIDYDEYARDICILANSIIKVKRIPEMDNYPEKRVELHCHSNMSAMDAVTDPVKLISRAAEWGHQAMAITDHGCVQAFPDCMYNMPKNFKVIYGMEAYVVNDIDRQLILKKPDNRDFNDEIIIFDVETTGLSFKNDRLTSIAAVKVKNLQNVDTFETYVNPGMHIPENITELTGITDETVANAPTEDEAVRKFMEFCGDNPILVAHNANFDITMINEVLQRHNINFEYNWLDTLIFCQAMLPELGRHRLNNVAKALKLGSFEHHRADEDALILSKIYIELINRLKTKKGFTNLGQINEIVSEIDVKQLK